MKELGRWLDPNAITWIAQAMTLDDAVCGSRAQTT